MKALSLCLIKTFLMGYYCFLNGKISLAAEATVHISDLALLRGYGVFDYLRTYHGIPFRLPDYLERFRASAEYMRLPLRYSDSQISEIIQELLIQSSVKETAGIRLLLTGGHSPDSMTITEPNFAIIVEALGEGDPLHYQHGVSLITYPFKRIFPLAKTTNYIAAIKMLPEVKEKKAFDMLYVWDNHVLELTRNNFFLVQGNTVITAKDDVLQGITRKVILELAAGKFKTEVRAVHYKELQSASEAFLCGSARRIIPVVSIDGNPVGNGHPGEVTRSLMTMFDTYVEEYTSGMQENNPAGYISKRDLQ
ncbi:MAG: branched chain amino acid aminotransferase [Chitinophagales bacterium]|nr:MAG: branched chain amino acid aminotransferase [Chitinophagales bacterium]